MDTNTLRSMYIQFFKNKGHKQISSASLIPENDPTVLFTTAGMHPLVPYLMGEQEHPSGKRLVDYQKCIRTGDIDSVGDPHHLTFFEMLGNWSLGDYFKKEMLCFSYEFLTEYLKINPDKLSVTVFGGDDEVPADTESVEIWQSLGIPKERIHFMSREDNWWGPAGTTGPCGPDSEMFIDTGKEKCSDDCHPGCKCGKYFEIWNDVFMQYNKTADGKFEKLARPCIDTGMGIERTVAILEGKKSVYEIETFQRIIRKIEELSSKVYGNDESVDTAIRIIADHSRTSVFILGDQKGVSPSNIGQGYILRRLIRRAVRYANKIGIEGEFLSHLAEIIIEMYKDAYPELENNRKFIIDNLKDEAEKFSQTLLNGEKEFQKVLLNMKKGKSTVIPGRIAFRLYDTYGFPLELTEDLAAENNFSVDKKGFEEAFLHHQELSRSSTEGVFKGGLQDHSEKTTALHTATHLLHKALSIVLGGYIKQLGSNITAERLRFDFNHDTPLTDDEKKKVEDLVNDAIKRDLPVTIDTMTLDEAKKSGAIADFEAKYGEQVKVYTIGDFSKEVCGGPHVTHTGELGHFRIVKEQSSSRGVRRIKAVLEK